ncbi:hypothetical protein SpyM50556 [Streptococcus pyogenes str. Manfredo]|nr:hypothetical protein SpyM50556 [Streptococcus pyogenes str. Manfredo]
MGGLWKSKREGDAHLLFLRIQSDDNTNFKAWLSHLQIKPFSLVYFRIH